MPYAQPRLRPDVDWTPIVRGDETIYFYKNPLASDYYKFNELQHEMLRRLDGKRSIQEICAEVSTLFEMDVPAEAGERFVEQLKDLKVLDDLSLIVTDRRIARQVTKAILWNLRHAGLVSEAPTPVTVGEPARSVALALGRLRDRDPVAATDWFRLAHELAPDDPITQRYWTALWKGVASGTRGLIQNGYGIYERYLPFEIPIEKPATFVARNFGFLFRWPFILFASFLGLISPILLLDAPPASGTPTASDVLFFAAVFYPAIWFHELMHASALVYMGRRTGPIRLSLRYGFLLTIYVDTLEAVLLSRRQRMVVYGAGSVGTALVIFALSIYSFLTPEGAAFHGVTIALAAYTIFMLVVYALNPFQRSDGYVILEDLLDEPNLDTNASQYFRQSLAHLMFNIGERPVAKRWKLYLCYQLLGSASLGCLWYQFYFVTVFGWLVEGYRGLGVLAWLGIGVSLFWVPLSTRVRQVSAFVRTNRRQLMRWRVVGSSGMILGLAIAALALIRVPAHIHAPFVVSSAFRTLVRAPEIALVHRVEVVEGQRVHAGDVLAVLEAPRLELELKQAQAEWAIQKLKLQLIKRGERPEEIQVRLAALRRARDERIYEVRSMADQESRAKVGIATSEGVEQSRQWVSEKYAAESTATAALALALSGSRQEDIAFAQARLAEAELAVGTPQ